MNGVLYSTAHVVRLTVGRYEAYVVEQHDQDDHTMPPFIVLSGPYGRYPHITSAWILV